MTEVLEPVESATPIAAEDADEIATREAATGGQLLPAIPEQASVALTALAGEGLTGGPLGIPTRDEMNDLLRFGKLLMASGMFHDLHGAAQAAVKIIAGRAFGLDPIQSQHAFYCVQGRLAPYARFQAALVKRSGRYRYRATELTEQAVELEWSERDRRPSATGWEWSEWEVIGSSRFTLQDAARAGLGKSRSGQDGGWQKSPKSMLFARALTQGVTWFCPHLLLGGGFAAPDDDLAAWGEEEE